jgi:hypothetical protein
MATNYQKIDCKNKKLLGQRLVELIETDGDIPSRTSSAITWLQDNACEFPNPNHYKTIQMIEGTEHYMAFTLPPKVMIEQAKKQIEEIIQTGGKPSSYLPDEYAQIFAPGSSWTHWDVFNFRVGDYFLGHCR